MPNVTKIRLDELEDQRMARLEYIVRKQQEWIKSIDAHYTSMHENLLVISKTILEVKQEFKEFLEEIAIQTHLLDEIEIQTHLLEEDDRPTKGGTG